MTKAKSKKTAPNFLYSTYRFRKGEQDPIIDRFRTALSDAGKGITDVSAESMVSRQTLKNWLDGKTRFPRFSTVAAAMGALGYRNPYERMPGKEKKKKVVRADPAILKQLAH